MTNRVPAGVDDDANGDDDYDPNPARDREAAERRDAAAHAHGRDPDYPGVTTITLPNPITGPALYMARVKDASRMGGDISVGDWLPVASLGRLNPLGGEEKRVSVALADFASHRDVTESTYLPFAVWDDEFAAFDIVKVGYSRSGMGWVKEPLTREEAWNVAGE